MINLLDIIRYPVKSLSPDPVKTVEVRPGEGLPGDRQYALAPGTTALGGTTIEWIAKNNFLVLVKHEKLAKLETSFDQQSTTLIVKRGGKQVARGNLENPVGRAMIESFFTAYMGEQSGGQVRIAKAAPGHSLEDQSTRALSIINLATLRDIERAQGAAVHPLRFRGNLYIDTGQPWQEFSWLGREISIGNVRLMIRSKTGRCGATNINPLTAVRDMNVLKTLSSGFSHTDCGVFADIRTAGTLSVNDRLSF